MFTSSILSQLYYILAQIDYDKTSYFGQIWTCLTANTFWTIYFNSLLNRKSGKNLHFFLKILAIRETWNLTRLMHFGLITPTKSFLKNFCSERKPTIWTFIKDWFYKNLIINYFKNLWNLITEPVCVKFDRNRAYDNFPWKLICQFFEFTAALVTRIDVRGCTDKQDLIYRYISNLQLHV